MSVVRKKVSRIDAAGPTLLLPRTQVHRFPLPGVHFALACPDGVVGDVWLEAEACSCVGEPHHHYWLRGDLPELEEGRWVNLVQHGDAWRLEVE